MASPFNFGAARGEKEVEEYEDPPEIVALRRLRQKFIHDIVPSHILPCLKTCLPRLEEDQIKAEERNKGPMHGAMLLLDFLVKKDCWYETLLEALVDDSVKLSHLATALKKELLVCQEEGKDSHFSRSVTFQGSYAEESSDVGLQSANCQSPSTATGTSSPQSHQSRFVRGSFTVNDVEEAMKDVGINLAGNAQRPVEPPPPYTPGTYFEDSGRLVQSAGGKPEQNKPLTVNQFFVNVNVGRGNVQVGSDNISMAPGNESEEPTDVKKSPDSVSKDDTLSHSGDEDCIIEEEIIEEEEDGGVGLMSEFQEEQNTSSPEKLCLVAGKEKSETTGVCRAEASDDDTDGTVIDTKLSDKDRKSNGTVNSSESVIATQSKTKSKIEYEKLQMRSYQEELAKPALEGKNCIICAPTGTGKTHVAMRITKHCLDKSLAEQAKLLDGNTQNMSSQQKAIFLVHRIPLLNQTYKRFKQYFPLLNIAKRSGASMTNTGFEMLVSVNDIIITTGGILKNCLDEKKVSLDQFALIIIDECHHSMKNHPYNVIMAEYLRLKLSNPTTQLPQIVGLTASPGAGSNSGLKTAADHILKLSANLDAHVFVTVKDEKNKQALRLVTNDPDKYTTVTNPRDPDPFKEKVEEIMTEIEKKAVLSGCGQRGTQRYESFIMEALNSATSEHRHEDTKCCEHLIEYNTALQMNSMCRMTDALDIIDSFYNERSKRGQHKTTEIEKWLYKLFRKNSSYLFDISEEEEDYSNPKVIKLKATLREEIDQKGQELRGIIFVKTRKLAKAVCECIKEDTTLAKLNPSIVTGIQAKTDDSMSQSDQDIALKNFSDGSCKLLVATSVVEEGLDIPECHMVIRYNYATNEISMRQSRGRARAQQSTEHFIGDTEVALKDKVNVFLDQQVEKAIDIVQQIPIDEFVQKLGIIQRSVVADRCLKERLQNLKKSANDADLVKLFCRGCAMYVCKGSDVYKYDCNHFIKDKDIIESKIEFREHGKQDKRDIGMMKIYCKNCKQDWGISLPPPQQFPVIKIVSFIVEYADGERKRKKKWKDTDFQPEVVQQLPFPEFTVQIV